jgi:tRNA(Ile)-lysidine synthase
VDESEERIAFGLEAWRALPTSLQRSTLREGIHRLRKTLRNINFQHVDNALLVARDGTTGDRATLPRNLMLQIGYQSLIMADADAAVPMPEWPHLPLGSGRVRVSIPGRTVFPGSEWALDVAVVERAELPDSWQHNTDPWRAYLDAARAGPTLWLRSRRPGDRFQPLGLEGHTVKLADFFTNQKVPRQLRDRVPLLASAESIGWVCGYRVDERFRVGGDTNQVLVLEFVRR